MKHASRWDRLKNAAYSMSAFLAELSIGVPGVIIAFANELPNRWWVLLLTVIFLAISAAFALLRGDHSKKALTVYLLIEAGLTVTLLALNPELNFYVIWFYVLTIEAIMGFPRQAGMGWLAGFVVLTVISLTIVAPTDEVIIVLPIYLGGFFFFATFANATFRANEAHRESQRLLEELTKAHAQLQAYAVKAEQLAVSEERNRLSREMHDTIGHRLTVASVQLEGVERLIGHEPVKAAAMTAVVKEQVREALGELRRTVATLREPLESDLPLETALRRLAADFQTATGLNLHLLFTQDLPAISPAHRLALYRTAQEALTNVQKHAGADQVWVQIASLGDSISLRVSDNGVGPAGIAEDAGFGLRGIRERAGRLGGELLLAPRRGGGTELTMTLPIVNSA